MSDIITINGLLLSASIESPEQTIFTNKPLLSPRSFVFGQNVVHNLGIISDVVISSCKNLCSVCQSYRPRRTFKLTGNWLHIIKTRFGSQQTPTQPSFSISVRMAF